jgi:hypothetical protein
VKRNRAVYAIAILLVIAAGLLSRRQPGCFPAALGKYPGDALWAMMVFIGFGILFPTKPTMLIGIIALAFSFVVELSQIYHEPWIDSARATSIGHLILGSGFSGTDLIAYAIGILLACLVEMGVGKISGRRSR